MSEPGAEEPVEDAGPPWLHGALRRGAGWLIIAIVVGGVALLGVLEVLDRLSDIITMLLTALFLSFALEPAVTFLASERGYRRGSATGLIFLIGFLVLVLIIALLIPAIVNGVGSLFDNADSLVARLADWLRPLRIDLSVEEITARVQEFASSLEDNLSEVAGGVLSVTATIFAGLFRWTAIGLFTFYMVAEGPKLRRAICGLLPPQSQKHVLFVWDTAITQTGGYFYSRLLLAVINAAGLLIVLLLFDVPFAAPLAIFCGVVSAFIPIVGTYIGGLFPVLVALLTSTAAGIAVVVYIVIYQQVENFYLSPRITAKTMSLHPAVAFGAALIGGALGGLLFAFLALPAAGVIQSMVKLWGRRYDVVETDLTVHDAAPDVADKPRRSLFGRKGDDGDA
ncbi:MAG TPA: AI-2E family transporter [Actinomycetota bacterium]|nr:AI-2E family transporter [Actinomycetota bacterium]